MQQIMIMEINEVREAVNLPHARGDQLFVCIRDFGIGVPLAPRTCQGLKNCIFAYFHDRFSLSASPFFLPFFTRARVLSGIRKRRKEMEKSCLMAGSFRLTFSFL